MNMKNWTYTNSASLLTVPTLSFSHKFSPKKFIGSENSHFQNYGNEEFNDPLENRFLLNWHNKKSRWNHYSDKFIVAQAS